MEIKNKTTLYNKQRQEQIVDLVRKKGPISVQELAERFQVSSATIRSDLTLLENCGELTRTHGGAMPKVSFHPEPAISERKNEDKKILIAAYAAGLVENYDSILIDTGTTAMFFAKELVKRPLLEVRVFTNDIEVARILEDNPGFEIHLLGGQIRSSYHYTYGNEPMVTLQRCRFQKLFLTTSALDITHGLTATIPHLAALKAQMIRSSEKVILLTDSTKYAQVCFQKFGELSDVNLLVMDQGLEENHKEILNIEVESIVWV